jgi:hypothetical protein
MSATSGGRIGNVTGAKPLVDMAMAYSRSRVLCAAARLGIADALAAGERTVAQIAQACGGADADALHRLLRALVVIGVTAESSPGTFQLTPFGQPLRKDAPNSAWPAVVFWADLLADSWSYLTDCVRTGTTAAKVMESRGIVSRWSSDPQAMEIFRAVMGTAPAEDYLPIVRGCDLGGARVVADLGGGGGSLIAAVLQAHPHLSGMLVDRPQSVDAAAPRFQAEGLASRCKLVAADLTQGVPNGADVYLIKHVLHGYSDAAALQILRNTRAVTPADGRLLVIEFVLPDVVSRADQKLEARLMSDLNMLTVTGGKERSAAQWTELLHSAGFELRRIVSVSETSPGQDVSIIEAQPHPLAVSPTSAT